jgi:hypothetical protein
MISETNIPPQFVDIFFSRLSPAKSMREPLAPITSTAEKERRRLPGQPADVAAVAAE